MLHPQGHFGVRSSFSTQWEYRKIQIAFFIRFCDVVEVQRPCKVDLHSTLEMTPESDSNFESDHSAQILKQGRCCDLTAAICVG